MLLNNETLQIIRSAVEIVAYVLTLVGFATMVIRREKWKLGGISFILGISLYWLSSLLPKGTYLNYNNILFSAIVLIIVALFFIYFWIFKKKDAELMVNATDQHFAQNPAILPALYAAKMLFGLKGVKIYLVFFTIGITLAGAFMTFSVYLLQKKTTDQKVSSGEIVKSEYFRDEMHGFQIKLYPENLGWFHNEYGSQININGFSEQAYMHSFISPSPDHFSFDVYKRASLDKIDIKTQDNKYFEYIKKNPNDNSTLAIDCKNLEALDCTKIANSVTFFEINNYTPYKDGHTYNLDIEGSEIVMEAEDSQGIYGIFRSKDLGKTWSLQKKLKKINDGSQIKADNFDDQEKYFVKNGSLHQRVAVGEAIIIDGRASGRFITKDKIYVLVHSYPAITLKVTAKTNINWQTFQGPANDCAWLKYNEINVVNSIIYVACKRSLDGGNTWETINPPPSFHHSSVIKQDKNNPMDLATVDATGKTFYITRDGSKSWKKMTTNINDSLISSFAIDVYKLYYSTYKEFKILDF